LVRPPATKYGIECLKQMIANAWGGRQRATGVQVKPD